MRWSWLFVAWSVAGCAQAPEWLDGCDCGEDVCVVDDDGTRCEPVPDSCQALYADRCDEGAETELDCVVDLCGDFQGGWSFEWDCHRASKGVARFADCTAVPEAVPAG